MFVKPVGGVFDSVSVLLDGFRRATQSDIKSVERIRLPRHSIPSEVSFYLDFFSVLKLQTFGIIIQLCC